MFYKTIVFPLEFYFRFVKVNISQDMWNTLITRVLNPISNGLSYDKYEFSMFAS